MRLKAIATAMLLVVGGLVLPVAESEAGSRGSVKHGSKKGAERGAKRGAATTGTKEGARAGASAGPNNRQSARAGYSRGYHHGRHDARYNNWNDARRDYYRWRTVTGLIKLGVVYSSRPKQSTATVVTGTTYYYHNGVYYLPSGTGYVVTAPPPGAVVYAVPTYTTVVYQSSTPNYYVDGAYYVETDATAQHPSESMADANVSIDSAAAESEAALAEVPMTDEDYNYEVVAPPVGATVPYLPEEANEQIVAGKTYFVYAETYYKPFVSDGETIYMVVDDPRTQA